MPAIEARLGHLARELEGLLGAEIAGSSANPPGSQDELSDKYLRTNDWGASYIRHGQCMLMRVRIRTEL